MFDAINLYSTVPRRTLFSKGLHINLVGHLVALSKVEENITSK